MTTTWIYITPHMDGEQLDTTDEGRSFMDVAGTFSNLNSFFVFH
jgi:hypothetical protein